MSRTRWLTAEWGLTIRQLANALRSAQFTEASSEGFVVDRIRRDSIEARFIQRLELVDVVIDPFGQEASYKRLSFTEQAFIATSSSPELQLTDGARSTQAFYSLLSQVTDFKFTVKAIQVDVDAWVSGYKRVATHSLVPDAIQIGRIAFNDGATGRAIVKAGSGNARAAVKQMVSDRPYVIEKVRLRQKQQNGRGTIVLSSNCSATLSGFNPHEAEVIREALRASLNEVLELS